MQKDDRREAMAAYRSELEKAVKALERCSRSIEVALTKRLITEHYCGHEQGTLDACRTLLNNSIARSRLSKWDRPE